MDRYSDGPRHFTVEKGPGRTVIFLRELFREVDIGIHNHEIGQPQKLRFDIEVSIPGSDPPKSDKITEVVNYEYLLESVEDSINGSRLSLLESLGSIILDLSLIHI